MLIWLEVGRMKNEASVTFTLRHILDRISFKLPEKRMIRWKNDHSRQGVKIL